MSPSKLELSKRHFHPTNLDMSTWDFGGSKVSWGEMEFSQHIFSLICRYQKMILSPLNAFFKKWKIIEIYPSWIILDSCFTSVKIETFFSRDFPFFPLETILQLWRFDRRTAKVGTASASVSEADFIHTKARSGGSTVILESLYRPSCTWCVYVIMSLRIQRTLQWKGPWTCFSQG